MSFPEDRSKRVDQSTYWVNFGVNIVLSVVLLGGGLYEIATGSIGTGILCIVLLFPLSIYFRVIMMRRCRDIGWPAFLPWLSIGLGMLFGMMNGFRMAGHPGATPSAAMFGLPMMINMLDFVFMIVLGCIGSKAAFNYADVFDDYDGPVRPAQPSVQRGYYGDASQIATPQPRQQEPARAPGKLGGPDELDGVDLDRWDAAIAKRLAAQAGNAAPGAAHRQQDSQFPAMQRPVGGFGRKMV